MSRPSRHAGGGGRRIAAHASNGQKYKPCFHFRIIARRKIPRIWDDMHDGPSWWRRELNDILSIARPNDIDA